MRASTASLGGAIALMALLATGLGSGCGSSDDTTSSSAGGSGASGGAGGVGAAGGGTAGASSDGGVGGGGGSSGGGPSTHAYDPCATAACWYAPTLGGCGATTVTEDFSSGSYNVHSYLLMAPVDVQVEVTLTRTAGSWSPTLIVLDEQGTTVHDGAQSYSPSGLEVETVSPAPSPDAVAVRIRAASYQHLAVFVTGASVVASDFSAFLPTDADYTLEATHDCAPLEPLQVRGVTLDAEQELWVRYLAEHVVPLLPGSASERIEKSAYVTWWSLKEGILHVNNPLSYSNCSIPPDQHIGPVDLCPNPNNAWQVGLSGVQAAWRDLEDVQALAQTVMQAQPSEVLVDAAATAGLGAATALGQAVATSTDRLQLSWLLRASPVGFEAEYPVVWDDCFDGDGPIENWCFGNAPFAGTQAAALEAIADLTTIFEELSP